MCNIKVRSLGGPYPINWNIWSYNILIEPFKALPGQETPRKPDEDYFKDTPKDLIKQIYRHFFADFVVFGFSPESVKKFVRAGTDKKFELDKESVEESRKNAKKISRKPDVQYKMCN